MAKPPFAEALDALLRRYSDEDSDEIISELELKLYALREDAAGAMGARSGDEEDDE